MNRQICVANRSQHSLGNNDLNLEINQQNCDRGNQHQYVIKPPIGRIVFQPEYVAFLDIGRPEEWVLMKIICFSQIIYFSQFKTAIAGNSLL